MKMVTECTTALWSACRQQVTFRLKLLTGVLVVLLLLPLVPVVIANDAELFVACAFLLAVCAATGVLVARRMRRSHYRFSVRALLAVLLITSLFMAMVSNRLRHKYAIFTATAEIQRHGGTLSGSRTPFGFAWLERWLGGGLVTRVDRIDLGTNRAAGVTLDQIHRLPDLRYLSLQHNPLGDRCMPAIGRCTQLTNLSLPRNVTDLGLQNLAGLSKLRCLSLRNTKVTDQGLSQLSSLSCLERLALNAQQITPDSIEHFKRLPNLDGIYVEAMRATDADVGRLSQCSLIDRLVLNGAPVTDAGLSHLQNMPQLVLLDVSGTAVTDAGIAFLRHTPRLAYLNLSGTAVTDAVIAHLRQVPGLTLTTLDLRGTAVTDACFEDLAALRGLQLLDVRGTQMSAKRIQDLRDRLPRCEIP